MARFVDGETVHFLMSKDGELYMTNEEIVNKVAAGSQCGSATIDRIDEKTNTIYFTSPLPEGVKN